MNSQASWSRAKRLGSRAKRVGVRFLLCYFALFCLTGQEIQHVPWIEKALESYTAFWHRITVWIAGHVLSIPTDFPMDGSGSGDTTFRWILLPCYLLAATLATVVWTLADRKGRDNVRAYAWLRFLMRASLGIAMLNYGIFKVLASQMPPPNPYTLSQRVAELTPMRLLWTFMGISPAYQAFTGVAEVIGGALLLVPWTTLLGALICVADMSMVFMLNLCYDVPVKLMSFHYLLMGIVLIAPQWRRLAEFFVLNRPTLPQPPQPLMTRAWSNRIAEACLLLLAGYAGVTSTRMSLPRFREWRPGESVLHGVWAIEEWTVDGTEIAAGDASRWRFATTLKPTELSIEGSAGGRKYCVMALDPGTKGLTLWECARDGQGNFVRSSDGRPQRKEPPFATLAYELPESDVLVLQGAISGKSVRARCRRTALIGDDFHWITDPPKDDS